LLIVHILGGLVGLLSGSVSMAARKGSAAHRKAGDVFVVSMLIMGASGAFLGFAKSQRSNVIAGSFTFYLVATAWLTARRKAGESGRAELGLALLGLVVGAASILFGWQAAHRAPGASSHEPAAAYFVFGAAALLAASGDVRLLVRGGVSGIPRLTRHLWRMCVALFIAAGSFFLGTASKTGFRARLFTKEIRGTHLPEIPVLVIVVLTIYWLFRVRRLTPASTRPGTSIRNRPEEKRMQTILVRILLICLLAPAAAATAQENPLSAFDKRAYGYMKGMVLRSAEKVPEESYGFKPADTVRSFGQVLGHVADAQYMFCSAVLGEKSPALKVEQTKTSKAELVAALKDAFAYCDKAYDGMTDAAAARIVKLFGKEDVPKLGVLSGNTMHLAEHYGNLITYMRLKGIVPPSSEPRPAEEPKK
jgi:uncharacterized damage-inducible protein DinB/uncharacterized membrane protein